MPNQIINQEISLKLEEYLLGLSYCEMLLDLTRFRLRTINNILSQSSLQEKQQIEQAIHQKLM
jgi:hypothetical protein